MSTTMFTQTDSSTITNLVTVPSFVILDNNPLQAYKIVIGNVEASNTMTIGWDRFVNYMNSSLESEVLLIEAVKNLIKKNEYLQLSHRLAEDQISEEEFEEELEKNTSKYLIKVNEMEDPSRLFKISAILNRLEK